MLILEDQSQGSTHVVTHCVARGTTGTFFESKETYNYVNCTDEEACP